MSQADFDQKAFDALPKLDRSLLQIIAIIYAPVAATPLASCAHHLGFDDDKGNAFTLHTIRPVLVDLIHTGFLEGSQGKYFCAPSFSEDILLSSIADGTFNDYSEQVLRSFSATESFGRVLWQSIEHGLSHARIYLFQGKADKLDSTLKLLNERYQYSESLLSDPGFYPATFGTPANEKLLAVLSDSMFSVAFIHLVDYGLNGLHDQAKLWDLLHKREQEIPNLQAFKLALLDTQAEYSILSGKLETFPELPAGLHIQDTSKLLENANTEVVQYGDHHVHWHLANSAKQLIHGNIDSAIQAYDNAVELFRELNNKRKGTAIVFNNDFEKFYLLALLASGDSAQISVAQKVFKQLDKGSHYDTDHAILHAYADTQISGIFNFNVPLADLQSSLLGILFYSVIKHWLGHDISDAVVEVLESRYQQTTVGNYKWLQAEYAHALGLASDDANEKKKYLDEAEALHKQLGTSSLFELVKPQAEWERALNAMNQLVTPKDEKGTANESEERIVWMLDTDRYNEYTLTPKLQKKTAKGTWTKGRNIALKRLKKEQHELPALSDQDLDLVSSIYEQPDYDSYYHRGPQFTLDLNNAWPKLVGHPQLFWDGARNTAIDLSQNEFELLVSEEGENLRISFYPPFDDSQQDSQWLIHKETPTRLCIYQKSEQVMRLSEIISNGIVIPREAEKNLRETLTTLAPMIQIQSDLEGVVDAEAVEPDSRIHANLLPYGDGLRVTLRVKPFGEFGAYFPAGEGRSKLSVEHEGKRLTTTRNLEAEKEQLDNLLRHSNILGEEEEFNDEYILEDPQNCLELLEQLQAEGEKVIVAWPEGEVMRIASRFDTNNLRLSINKSGDWFQLEGNVSTDPSLVLSLRQLLGLTQGNKGRFIQMEDGQYISLSSQFKKKLDAIHRYSELNEDGAKISGLASLALEDLTDMVGELTVDEAWKKQIHDIQELDNHHPELPSTLQADLRDYQEEGFRWMSRLAKWGVGACLADDMGLGKTVQTIALLLERATLGPVLVVAPTSVSNNWESELNKFAPTLKPYFYRDGGRQELLDRAKEFDVVIASYGLLQQDGDMFIEKHWATIVLDEAQAIKNINAKRTKIAHKLQADLKIVTTGTPIENHLGELWSLFRFLNPGLLGTQQQFMEHFIGPIERDNDADARNHLKRLIQPFILRRTKTQVLDELPPKTEITVEIPLSEGERAMYEAVRVSALENIAKDKGEKQQGGNHLKVLAAITKLRLASCHPKLVMEDSTLTGSKLEYFGNLVEELLENNHKALVFSQFVKYLAIIREYLDAKGISYQYLDGSTPVAQRKTRVDEFQDGKGDLFLISLKAGGSGLNLTAADYVIHMDPWWNPAVENQASDRAHRIGQTRPVTIYRLVAENTIEQKIVKLHQHKRELADSLLEGSDMSGSMNAADMLEMMREV